MPSSGLSPVQRRMSTGSKPSSPAAKNERVIKMDGGLQGRSDENLLQTLQVKKQDSTTSNLSRVKTRVSGCLEEFKSLDENFTHV